MLARNFFILIFSMLFLLSCSKEKETQPALMPDGCRDTLFTYETDVLPILNINCNFDECHAGGGEGSYDFTSYAVVANRVKAGTFEYRLDLPFEDPQHMPEKMKLSKCDYYTLKSWIIQGYPEN